MRTLQRRIDRNGRDTRKLEQRRARRKARRAGLLAGSAILATLLGGAAHAEQFTVRNTNDSGTDSLREKIELANRTPEPDTIVFDQSVQGGTIDLTSGALEIKTDLTIGGPGAGLLTIDGGGSDRVFWVDGGEGKAVVEVSGLTMTNGRSAVGVGGCLWGHATALTLSDVTASNCVADGSEDPQTGYGFGGAIFLLGDFSGPALNVSHSSFYGNVAGQIGDGVVESTGSGGAIAVVGAGDVVIEDSVISGNTAACLGFVPDPFGFIPGGGGVIIAPISQQGLTGSLTILRSTISDNLAGNAGDIGLVRTDGYGGGVFSQGAELSIVESTISNNLAGNKGTAGYAFGAGGGIDTTGPLSMINSTVSGNTAGNLGTAALSTGTAGGVGVYETEGAIESSTIARNRAVGDRDFAGGIRTPSSAFTMHNTIVAENVAADGPDILGAVQGDYLLIEDDSDVVLTGTMITIGPANLGPLMDNGGPTETHAISSTSPALDAGDPNACTATDQRGASRPQGAGCDVGAFELASPFGGILQTFDDFVDAGSLVGNGPGASGPNRLNALRNKLATVDALAAQGDTEGACDELASSLLKTDGDDIPPDFVKGEAANDLAAAIQQAQIDLGCE